MTRRVDDLRLTTPDRTTLAARVSAHDGGGPSVLLLPGGPGCVNYLPDHPDRWWGLVREAVARVGPGRPDPGAPTPDQLREERARRHEVVASILRGVEDPHGLLSLVIDAPDVDAAHEALRDAWGLSEVQAHALLDLQVRRLAAGERRRIHESVQDTAPEE